MDPVSSIPKKTFSLTEKLDHLKQLIKDLNPYQRSLLGMALLLFGFLAAVAVAQQTQDIRQRASSSSPISSPITPTPISAPITPTPSCVTSNPTISVIPSDSQTGVRGQTLTYIVQFTNNDSLGCNTATFNFNLGFLSGWTLNINKTTAQLAPKASTLIYVTATSPSAAAFGYYNIVLNASTNTPSYRPYQFYLTYTVSAAVPSPTPTPAIPTSTPTPLPTPTPTPQIPTPTPTSTPITCAPSDIDKDGQTDNIDLGLLLNNFFSTTPNPIRTDINQDGIVDIRDYSILAINYPTQTGPCQ